MIKRIYLSLNDQYVVRMRFHFSPIKVLYFVPERVDECLLHDGLINVNPSHVSSLLTESCSLVDSLNLPPTPLLLTSLKDLVHNKIMEV